MLPLFACCCVMSLCDVLLGSDLDSPLGRQQQGILKSLLFSLIITHILFPFTPSDDRSSAASGLDVADRLTYLEQRIQMQEDEIQLLKMALADVLKRLNISEEHHAAAATTSRRPTSAKGEQNSACRPEQVRFKINK